MPLLVQSQVRLRVVLHMNIIMSHGGSLKYNRQTESTASELIKIAIAPIKFQYGLLQDSVNGNHFSFSSLFHSSSSSTAPLPLQVIYPVTFHQQEIEAVYGQVNWTMLA